MEIGHDVIARLQQWNTPPSNEYVEMDYQFALALFLSLVSPNEILQNIVDQNVMDFVLGKY